jgi:chromosome segregation ATPase
MGFDNYRSEDREQADGDYVAQLEAERDTLEDAMAESKGMASGFWGRACARSLDKRRKAEAERNAALARIDDYQDACTQRDEIIRENADRIAEIEAERAQLQHALAEAKAEHVRLEAERDAAEEDARFANRMSAMAADRLVECRAERDAAYMLGLRDACDAALEYIAAADADPAIPITARWAAQGVIHKIEALARAKAEGGE